MEVSSSVRPEGRKECRENRLMYRAPLIGGPQVP